MPCGPELVAQARQTHCSKESVITLMLATVRAHFSHCIIFLHSFTPAKEVNKIEKDKRRDKVKSKKCDFWMDHAIVFQSTSPRTCRSPSISSTGFYVHWKCLHGVRCIPRARETKCGLLKTDCFQWLGFTFLCFLHIQFWFDWLWLNVGIKETLSWN